MGQSRIYFDPLEGDILPGEPVIKHTGNRLQVAVPVTDEWGDKPATLAGKTLSFVVTNGDKAQQTQLTVGAAPADAVQGAPAGTVKMLAFALLGGLILNLMPCVLPVMGMKLSSVLQAGTDTRKIRLRFPATSAGILTSFYAAGHNGDRSETHRRVAGLGHPVPEPVVYWADGCRDLYLRAEPVWCV